MDYIRRSGNNVAHSNKKLGRDEAMLCLENLFIYLDYIAYCYADQYEEHSFDKTIITSRIKKAKESTEAAKTARIELEKEQEKFARQELDLQKLMEENASLERKTVCPQAGTAAEHMCRSHLIYQNIKPGSFTLILCCMDAGWIEGQGLDE